MVEMSETMSPHERFVRGVLPDVYLCEFGYAHSPRFLVYARELGCPALIPSQKTAKAAWERAARILGYYAPHAARAAKATKQENPDGERVDQHEG